MQPPEPPELAVVGALHPERKAVDARRPQDGKLPPKCRVGVALDGNLRARRDPKARIRRLEDARKAAAPQYRRGAAAEIDGIERRERVGRPPDGADGRVGIGVHQRLVRRHRVEVAVGAFALTEGDVDIEGVAHGNLLFCRPAGGGGFFGFAARGAAEVLSPSFGGLRGAAFGGRGLPGPAPAGGVLSLRQRKYPKKDAQGDFRQSP